MTQKNTREVIDRMGLRIQKAASEQGKTIKFEDAQKEARKRAVLLEKKQHSRRR